MIIEFDCGDGLRDGRVFIRKEVEDRRALDSTDLLYLVQLASRGRRGPLGPLNLVRKKMNKTPGMPMLYQHFLRDRKHAFAIHDGHHAGNTSAFLYNIGDAVEMEYTVLAPTTKKEKKT
jgi:hypothetical protein